MTPIRQATARRFAEDVAGVGAIVLLFVTALHLPALL
jgi:hypothetical protein